MIRNRLKGEKTLDTDVDSEVQEEPLDLSMKGPRGQKRSLAEEGACERVEKHQKALYKRARNVEVKLTTFKPRDWKGCVETVGVKIQPQVFGSKDWNEEEFRQKTEESIRAGLKACLDGEVEGTQHQVKGKKLKKVQIIVCNKNLHTKHRATKLVAPHDVDWLVTDAVNILCDARQSEEHKRQHDPESANDILLEDTEFHISRVYSEPLFGGRRAHHRLKTRKCPLASEFCRKKLSCLDPIQPSYHGKRMPKKAQDWCLPIAVVLGVHHITSTAKELKRFHNSTGKLRKEVEKLLAKAGVSEEGPYAVSELAKFQKALGDGYQITCYYSAEEPTYIFGPDNLAKQINIFLDSVEGNGEDDWTETVGHCYLIKSMEAFIAKSSNSKQTPAFCLHCKSSFLKEKTHSCEKSRCKLCKDPVCENKTEVKLRQHSENCPTCDRHMWTKECLDAHKTHPEHCKKPRCISCGLFHEKDQKKLCGLHWCSSCNKKQPFDHTCYMQKDKPKAPQKPMKRIYADLECMRMEDTGKQVANMLTVRAVTADGQAMPAETFEGKDCIFQFIEKASKTEQYQNSYLIFHNMKGYDGHFFLEELVRLGLKLEPLLRGQDILSMEICSLNIKLRDSMLYIPGTPLSAFPKMFKLDSNLAKGFFPHTLNAENQLEKPFFEEKGLRFPPKYHFEPEKMSPGTKNKFDIWWKEENKRYEENPELKYVVAEELRRYNLMDVELLMLGMETYLDACRAKHPAVDPLASITLPSYVNTLFRNYHMEQDSIALLPPDGFCPQAVATSKKELAWLLWMKKKLGLVELYHNRNFRPINIAGFHVDGWGKDAAGQWYVLEFNGCHYHGCDHKGCKFKTTPKRAEAQAHRISQRLQAKIKKERLERFGAMADSPYGAFQYIEIWEHEYEARLKEDKDMKKFVEEFNKTVDMKNPLSMREAFLGGRTEIFQHLIEVDGKAQWVIYVDFTRYRCFLSLTGLHSYLNTG